MKEKSRAVQDCLEQFTEGDSLQEGFILLQNLLSGRQELRGPTYSSSAYSNRSGDASIQLGRLLGTGAFSSVYALKEQDKTFLKIPKSRRCVKVLNNEAEVLKELTCLLIPTLFLEDAPHLGILTVQSLCEKSELPSLMLKGLVGFPASKVDVPGLNNGDLQRIVEDVTSALKHVHSRGWIHLDVRPSNIIVGQSGNAIAGVQLIDFGCAARKTTELSHFRGCPPFAHSDLLRLRTKKWQPETKHDMASLAFTIASLLAGDSVPWFGFSGCNVELDRLSERSDIATKLLGANDNKLNETTRTLLIESIHGSLTGVQTRSQKRLLASPEQRGAKSKRRKHCSA
jgi:serine/threonine protein kinase